MEGSFPWIQFISVGKNNCLGPVKHIKLDYSPLDIRETVC